jgi:CubicO group peptidase (beta-lactamase class C family)
MAKLDLVRLLGDHASRHSVPGAALGVLHDGAVTTAYCGVADSATREAVTEETRFAVGSLTKSMVATAVARLAEAGKLSLDDQVARHVPELRRTRWGERATVRDLLANRSRLPLRAAVEFTDSEDEDDGVLSRFAADIAADEATADVWSYTNAGWCVLGRMIETLTGLTWEEAMDTNLLVPLGMDQTTFAIRTIAEPRASGHEVTADGVVPVEPWTPRSLGPAGSTLLSTLTDMLRFAQRHLEDASLAMLRAPHAEIRIHGWLDAWCLGLAQFDWDGRPVWGWDGVISGQRAILRIVPDRSGAIVLLSNCGTGRALYRSLFADVMEKWFDVQMPALQLEPAPAMPSDLSRFAGVYAWPDRQWEVRATDTCLVMDGPRARIEAVPIDGHSFLVDAADPDTPTVTFGAFDENGRPGVLYQMVWGLPRA